ncbi:hypothetical protein ABH004_22100, partial [Bacteroides ovatus]
FANALLTGITKTFVPFYSSFPEIIVEPGNIQMRVVDWASDGDVSGTSINDDYNKYIIERGKQLVRRVL